MNLLFFGSPAEVIPILAILHAHPDFNLVAVVTQPDRPIGKKKILTPTPVKTYAKDHHLSVLTPREFDGSFFMELQQLIMKSPNQVPASSPTLKHSPQGVGNLKTSKLPLGILAAYGQILPHSVVTLPTHGIINLHPSLLPQYRGATPTIPPILKGEPQTGLSYQLMAEAMDAGDIIAQFTEDIQPTDTHLTLTTRLFQRSAEYLSEIITEYLSHQSNPNRYKLKAKSYSLYLPPQPQDNNQATFSHTFTKNHAHLPWDLIMAAITGQPAPVNLFPSSLKKHITDQYQPDQAARYVERAIRALSPWPGAWTQVPHLTTQKGQPRRLKLLKANLETSKPETLKLIEVRLEGKSTVSWEQFKAAYLDKN